MSEKEGFKPLTRDELEGAELLFSVEIADANQPVSVAPPEAARPITELPAA